MRLRNKPWAEPFIKENNDICLTYDEDLKNRYNEIFNNGNKSLNLEIGMGKGDFILGLSKLNKDKNYIGLEKFTTVLAIAAKKIVNEEDVKNVRLLCIDAQELRNLFNEKSLDNIYLNFSDPWPKARHAKRRLTYKTFLDIYYDILKDDGRITMKTDNLNLFLFSLESINEHGKFEIIEHTFDYEFDSSNDAMSEYEHRFRNEGVKINRLVLRKKGL